jgi:biotin carboxylase
VSATLLAVGCGPEQVAGIRAARKLGYRVVGVDGNPQAVGAAACDLFVPVDIADEAAVIEEARLHSPVAVIPTPIGRFLTTVGAVNDALCLRGVSRETALLCTDKERFHAALVSAGYPRPWRQAFTQWSELDRVEAVRHLPVILKPRHGSGSRGVRTARTAEELARHVAELSETAGFDAWLCEGLVEGTEFGVDGWVRDGEAHVVAIRQKTLTPEPMRQVVGYSAGVNPPAETRAAVTEAMRQVVRAVRQSCGLFQADIIVRDDGSIHVIEFAARPPGLVMAEEMVPRLTGVDVLSAGIELVARGAAPPSTQVLRHVELRFLRFRAGTIRAVAVPPPTPPNALVRTGVAAGMTLHAITSGADVLQRGWVMAWSVEGAPLTESSARRVCERVDSIERSWLDVVQF